MSSNCGKVGVARMAAYCASKFGVIGFTQALAMELAPHGITVNAICPGSADTDRLDYLGRRPDGTYDEALRRAGWPSGPPRSPSAGWPPPTTWRS